MIPETVTAEQVLVAMGYRLDGVMSDGQTFATFAAVRMEMATRLSPLFPGLLLVALGYDRDGATWRPVPRGQYIDVRLEMARRLIDCFPKAAAIVATRYAAVT